MNVEAQTINVPTGLQDYRPALYGGLAALELEVDGIHRVPLDVDLRELERRIVLCYTGEPRNSGTNNWEITKKHIDGDRHVFDCFERIRDTAAAMREALVRGDWDATGARHRQRVGEPQAAGAGRDDARHRRPDCARARPPAPRPPRSAAPAAAAACSATARPRPTARIREALADGGARLLDFTFERHGLTRG